MTSTYIPHRRAGNQLPHLLSPPLPQSIPVLPPPMHSSCPPVEIHPSIHIHLLDLISSHLISHPSSTSLPPAEIESTTCNRDRAHLLALPPLVSDPLLMLLDKHPNPSTRAGSRTWSRDQHRRTRIGRFQVASRTHPAHLLPFRIIPPRRNQAVGFWWLISRRRRGG